VLLKAPDAPALAKEAFNKIKEWISKEPILIRPDFNKDSIIYLYAPKESYVIMIIQNDDEGCENTIVLLS